MRVGLWTCCCREGRRRAIQQRSPGTLSMSTLAMSATRSCSTLQRRTAFLASSRFEAIPPHCGLGGGGKGAHCHVPIVQSDLESKGQVLPSSDAPRGSTVCIQNGRSGVAGKSLEPLCGQPSLVCARMCVAMLMHKGCSRRLQGCLHDFQLPSCPL